jgi:anti-sigma regulatory factor (Ser/Thr protein kinase)
MSRATAITVTNDLAELERLSRVVEEFGRAEGLSAQVIFDLQLAANEIVTNVILHGYDDEREHAIVVRLVANAGEVTLEVEDDGRAFDPSIAPAPRLDLPLEERPLGGLGVHLARRVTDAIEYRRQDDRNILRMRKKTA